MAMLSEKRAKSAPIGVRLLRRAANDAARELHEAAPHLAHGVLVGQCLYLLRQRLALAQVPPGYCARRMNTHLNSSCITLAFMFHFSAIAEVTINDISVFTNCSIIIY